MSFRTFSYILDINEKHCLSFCQTGIFVFRLLSTYVYSMMSTKKPKLFGIQIDDTHNSISDGHLFWVTIKLVLILRHLVLMLRLILSIVSDLISPLLIHSVNNSLTDCTVYFIIINKKRYNLEMEKYKSISVVLLWFSQL